MDDLTVEHLRQPDQMVDWLNNLSMRLAAVEATYSAEALAKQAQLSEPQHPPKICSDPDCPVCGDSRALLAQAVRKSLFEAIAQAASDVGLLSEADEIANRLAEIEAGQPLSDLAIDGLLIRG